MYQYIYIYHPYNPIIITGDIHGTLFHIYIYSIYMYRYIYISIYYLGAIRCNKPFTSTGCPRSSVIPRHPGDQTASSVGSAGCPRFLEITVGFPTEMKQHPKKKRIYMWIYIYMDIYIYIISISTSEFLNVFVFSGIPSCVSDLSQCEFHRSSLTIIQQIQQVICIFMGFQPSPVMVVVYVLGLPKLQGYPLVI